MKPKDSLRYYLAGGGGVLIQWGTLIWLVVQGISEFSLLVALFTGMVGTVLLMYAIESRALAMGRADGWALAAFLNVIGFEIGRRWRGEWTPPAPRTPLGPDTRPLPARIVSWTLTGLITLAMLWAAYQWMQLNRAPRKPGPAEMQRNEQKAYAALLRIGEAQEKYKNKDWDGDGIKTYALFLPHLWQTVDGQVRPVKTRLLPKSLAFAMNYSTALDGYYFEFLYTQQEASGETMDLNMSTHWALVAGAQRYGETGVLTFLADSSGRIYAKALSYGGVMVSTYPYAPEKDGWRLIKGEADLRTLQREVDYSAS